jgi:hypothetical protein
MAVSLIMIDDFLGEPESFRERALGLTYTQSGAYPGYNSVERINLEGLDQEISGIVREPLRAPSPPESHGKCRLALAGDDKPGKIHVDPSYWSGILYLSRPEDCQGGTEFYRHIPTGTDQAPTDVTSLNNMGYFSYPEMRQEILERDAFDRSKWELTMTVPMRFNRLVLLRPWLWHTSGPGFGDSIENGRLIYVMFFRPDRQWGQSSPQEREL